MRVHTIALTTLLLGFAQVAFGQVNPLSTIVGLKAACETNPGNVVRITTDMTVNVNGTGAVRTGCTLELVGDSEIQFDKVSMSFAGPFAITGGTKSGLQLQHAVLSAPSVSIRLIGGETDVKSEFSRINATAGDLESQRGRIGKIELMYNATAGVPLTRATLAATGALRISAGDKLSAAMKEVGLVAGTTLSFTGTGSESELKLDDTGVLSIGGSVSIGMLGSKREFKASNASLTARGGDLDLAMGHADAPGDRRERQDDRDRRHAEQRRAARHRHRHRRRLRGAGQPHHGRHAASLSLGGRSGVLRSRPRSRCLAAAALAACMACCATAATAAGAATVYGRVDLNLTRIEGTGWQMTQASTSRIGVRGSEPLGSGVSVQFQLEARIDANTGGAESRFWGRESWIGLQGGFGRMRLGRSLSPSQRLASNHDPHGTDGIGSFGSGGLLLGHSALVRLGNAVFVETLSWHGLSASGALQLDEGGGPSARARSLRLRYAAGPVDASAASAAIGNGDRVTSFGATWDFGVLKPMAQWHCGRRDGIERRSALVGATLALPSGVVRLAVSQHERATGERRRQTLAALGYDHALSRRTQLYGTVAQQRVGNRSPAGRIGLEAGLRHSF